MSSLELRTAAAVAIALAVSACSGSDGDVTPSPTQPSPTASFVELPTESSPPQPTPSVSEPVVALPVECEGRGLSLHTEDDPIAAAVATAELPDDMVLMGTQVLDSVDEDGMFDALVRTCSPPVSDDEAFAIGTLIGAAIEADPAGETLATLRVTFWGPDGSGSIDEGTRIRCEDFQMYLWADARSDDSNWKLAGRDY